MSTVPIYQLLLVCIIGCIAAGHKGSTLRFSDVLLHEKSKMSPGVLAAVFEISIVNHYCILNHPISQALNSFYGIALYKLVYFYW